MSCPIISVSAAPYDGYSFPQALESLARCGVSHVEPAFIVGYTGAFDESAFLPSEAARYASWMKAAGIGCHAFSSHIDLGLPNSAEVFAGRMAFAAHLGARVINTNAAARANSDGFFRNIEPLMRHAEQLGLIIGLENPGDGSDNLVNSAADGIALVRRLDSEHVRLNYDAGNTISHRPAIDPAADAILALPACGHVHIKDVRRTPEGFFFTPLGQGDIDCAAIVRALAATPLNLSIEMPLRLHRGPNAQPARRPDPVPLAEIEAAITAALAFVNTHLKEAA